MSDLLERAAQASGGYTDEEWAALVASSDELDKMTVTNARAVAANILAIPEIADDLQRREYLRGLGAATPGEKGRWLQNLTHTAAKDA